MLVLITTGENLLYWDQRGLTKKNLVAPWKISRKFFQNKSIFHGERLVSAPRTLILLIPHYLHMARILFLTLHKHNSLGKGDLYTSRNLIMSHFNGVPITAISKMAGYEPLFLFPWPFSSSHILRKMRHIGQQIHKRGDPNCLFPHTTANNCWHPSACYH